MGAVVQDVDVMMGPTDGRCCIETNMPYSFNQLVNNCSRGGVFTLSLAIIFSLNEFVLIVELNVLCWMCSREANDT